MGWKVRQGVRYYYRSVREGDRVRTEYVGTGEAAELIAEADRLDALERKRAAEAWRDCRRTADAADRAAALACGRSGVLARLALEAAGFRRHKRGQWRKARASMGELQTTPGVV